MLELKLIQFCSLMARDMFHQPRLLQTPSNFALNTSREDELRPLELSMLQMLPLHQQIIQELLACHNTLSHIQSPAHASETSPLEALGGMCTASTFHNANNPGRARLVRSTPGALHLCGAHTDPQDADKSVKCSHLRRSPTGPLPGFRAPGTG